jgi:hypothetical protein
VFWDCQDPTCYQSHSWWAFHFFSQNLYVFYPSISLQALFENSCHMLNSSFQPLKLLKVIGYCHFLPNFSYSSAWKPTSVMELSRDNPLGVKNSISKNYSRHSVLSALTEFSAKLMFAQNTTHRCLVVYWLSSTFWYLAEIAFPQNQLMYTLKGTKHSITFLWLLRGFTCKVCSALHVTFLVRQ